MRLSMLAVIDLCNRNPVKYLNYYSACVMSPIAELVASSTNHMLFHIAFGRIDSCDRTYSAIYLRALYSC